MVAVIFVGHGAFPAGVRDAVEMILGVQDNLAVVSLRPEGSTEQIGNEVAHVLAALGAADGEALVLADLAGGSPANAVAALVLANPELQLVSGLNVPMALEVLTSTHKTASGLADVAARAGGDGVLDVAARLRTAAS